MENKELLEKLEALEKRLSELESLKKDNLSMFGRSYALVGNSNSDFLIKTKGLVKIQWGSKFIDLIKDGKINVDASFIFSVKNVDKIGIKDGLYVTEDGSVYLKIGDNLLNLVGEVGSTYVSFLEEQETSSELKYTALGNIGFLYKDLNSIGLTSLKNGIIYVESEEKLYIIKDGAMSEFTIEFPNPYTQQFVIAKSDESKGALLIKGEGINNSLAFEKLFIYTDFGDTYIDANGSIYFRIGSQEKLIIGDAGITFVDPAIGSMFLSSGATESVGFRLYVKYGESTLEVDNLIVRKSSNLSSGSGVLVYPTYWYNSNNIISKIEKVTNSDSPGEEGYQAELVYENQYQVNDSIYVYATIKGEKVSTQIKIPLLVKSLDTEYGNTIYVAVDTSAIDLSELEGASLLEMVDGLTGLVTFLAASAETPQTILRRSAKNIDLVTALSFQEELDIKQVKTRFGNLTELGIKESSKEELSDIEGDGIYSKKAYFEYASYINPYELEEEDDSTKMASTEWVRKLINRIIPKGTITAYHGDTIPEGWALCNGDNGTPNLIGKFIKAGETEEEGGLDEILLKQSDIPSMDASPSITTNPGAYAGNKIPVLDKVEEYVFDEGGSSHYCVYTGYNEGDNGLTQIEVSDLGSLLSLSGSVGVSPDEQTPIKIEPKYYSLVFIMKIE